MKSLIDRVRDAGVVGAGGGGFPAHVKLGARADTVIANGAECEPLLHKDAVVMERSAAAVVRGVELCVEALGAKDGVVGIKAKNHHAVEAMQRACADSRVRVHLLGDYYPAGDEYDLVHEVTGRLIPPGGLPLQVGVVVNNVETLANVAAAAEGRPVIHKTLTLAGAVRSPVTVRVPVGVSYREAFSLAGGLTTEEPVLCVGGLMMGQVTTDLDTPITKTSTGVVVLPRSHPVMRRKLKPEKVQAAIGKSACDQCRYCTEFCPRYLLGYSVEPHQVMRSLAFTATGEEVWSAWAALCCSCGLCTLYACPEELFPKEACDQAKVLMRERGMKRPAATDVRTHPMRDGRQVPIQRLVRKLDVGSYDLPAPWSGAELRPRRLVLPLKQSAGVPNRPSVRAGDRVQVGQQLGEVPSKALGAPIHAPVAGRVEAVNDVQIVLENHS